MFEESDWVPDTVKIDATDEVQELQWDYDEQAKTWKEPEAALEGSAFFLDKENEEMTVLPTNKPLLPQVNLEDAMWAESDSE